MENVFLNELPDAELPIVVTDKLIVSRNGQDLSKTNFGNLIDVFVDQATDAAVDSIQDLVDVIEQNVQAAEEAALLASQSVSNGAKPYATYAAALADLANIATNQIVEVVTDETRNNQRSLYIDNGTTLVFLRAVEQYVSQIPYIASDSFQNMITKLLVISGAIPEVSPTLDADFTDPNYL